MSPSHCGASRPTERTPHGRPQPYDQVRLNPAAAGIAPGTVVVIADTVDDEPGTYVAWHLEDHSDYQDWAAAVTAADIHTITRITDTGDVRTWTPSP
ncbi:DUF6211 family protein [Streptomyces erythrochromogenes]|uniref:DUF6211 family protein n=1 Tax=Streptomyces erythrochromogenes TaxID=285574 RepID=UPI003684557E